MKTIASALVYLTVITFSKGESGKPPDGVSSAEWSSIHTAFEAGRHAVHQLENGNLAARNPGQQWIAEFDGKGLLAKPDHGQWTWGLELTGYGDRTLLSASSSITHDGGKINCQRDENLTEWFINDSRGLEQGWTFKLRPNREVPDAPLPLHLSTRGNLNLWVASDGNSVSFQTEAGGSALIYGGLKAWDADGNTLPVRFEKAGENQIQIAVEDQSARYPITIDPIAQQAYIKASNTDADDWFGKSVAISGDTMIIGAPYEDSSASGVNGNQYDNSAGESGAAYVFTRSGGVWTQQAYLKASNTDSGDAFGQSVAVSGDTIVVGAPGQGRDDIIPATTREGAAYVFVRSGNTWTQQAYLKASFPQAGVDFGNSVAVSGDTLVIGAYNDRSNATGVNGNASNQSVEQAGAAYVFARSGSVWTKQAYLKASNTGAGDYFGRSVAVSGDTVVVGADGEDSNATGVNNGDQVNNDAANSGAAYVFTRAGTNWSQQAYLKASAQYNSASFGQAVAVYGATVCVASQHAGSSIFFRTGTSWIQQSVLIEGNSIAISGDTIAVGFINDSDGSTGVNQPYSGYEPYSGAARVFTRSGATWTEQAYLKASNTGQNDELSCSVAISGDTVVVGAYGEDSNATGINGNQSDNSASRAGASYVFTGFGPVAGTGQSALHLRFDEAAGTTALDSSGNNLNGTLVGGPGFTTGRINRAVNLSGVGQFISLPAGVVSTSYYDFTVTAWVKPDTLGTWARIFDLGTGADNYMSMVALNGFSNTFSFSIRTPSTGDQYIDSSTPLTVGVWSHVAIARLGNTATLYLNGVPVGTNNAMTLRPSDLGITTQNYIGKSQFAADPAFDGLIDEFQIFARALTGPEIASLATPPAIESWRQTWFGTTSNSGNAANDFDYDKDGLVNLLEFAFGLSPTLSSLNQIPQPQWSGGNFGFSFATPPGVSGITYGTEWSATMTPLDWHGIADTGIGNQHVFNIPTNGNPRRFLRLTVTSQQ